ncbi:MAG: thioredoxin family protein [Thermoanaerobaculales bacterium]|nr:thioredoxin family protein [Thermoanaerobaculales bacterium]
MNRLLAVTIIALAATSMLLNTSCSGPEDSQVAIAETRLASSHGNAPIKWASDWKTALERADSEDKAVLVTFYADWCIWCKRLENTTLANAKVVAYLTENVVPIRLDVDNEGRTLSNNYRVDGLPTVLVLNARGKEIGRIPGYLPPDGFLDRVRAFLG